MLKDPLNDFRSFADMVTPQAVAQYLAAHSWNLVAQRDQIGQIWQLPGTRAQIMLPFAHNFVDFHRRFEEALESLSRIQGIDATQLYEQIISARSDLLLLRLDQTTMDGTIPFKQAESTIHALYKMMRAAATTAVNPCHSQQGRRPDAVGEFMEDDVRLGHTKQGSFIFTLVARHRVEIDPHYWHADDQAKPFPRQVMEVLAQGLETTRKLAFDWDERILDDPGRSSLASGLAESLEEIAQSDEVRGIDLNFDWSASGPPPDVGLATIDFSRDVLSRLPVVRERLSHQEEVARRVTITGYVRALKRSDDPGDDEESAAVEMVADVDGKQRVVHMTLSGYDHELAIKAYQKRLPFSVAGNLSYERKSWRLDGTEILNSLDEARGGSSE
ncbi:hypothetical protein HNR06_000958 [Nocardiopsis arvandica]|uniref:Uncharacterized protein n=1 Tax=Nocardiopsis sinuspersici TaxID=501010 RepID=A0A7Y9X903_9ACTN|nr:hypothetical protein [Nocardiopsis sinuspersici]NYH51369.1 hypothetical protein [Nocardiopsis sinuspersici]